MTPLDETNVPFVVLALIVGAAVCFGLGYADEFRRARESRPTRRTVLPPPAPLSPEPDHVSPAPPDSGRDRKWLEDQVERRRVLRRVK